jgi:O-antigen/teichoic acid export membrane protein
LTNTISKSIVSGAIWSAFQMVGTKVFSMLGQLILAWILLPQDFGKISLVYTLTSLGIVLQNFGLTDVLISRGKSFDILIPLAKSITFVLATASIVVVLLLGVAGGIIYDDIEITYLVLIFSLSIPFNTFSVIPDAKLRSTLQFRTLSLAQFYGVFLTQLFTIILALLSFGVYSFVIPAVIVAALNYLYLNYHSGIGFLFKVTFRRWSHLVNNSAWGFVSAICHRVIQQFDFAVLGLFALQAEVGIYYLAFSLSVQAIGLLVGSIAPVLFPALNKVPKEDKTQLKIILLRITAVLALLGMPFALWQAVSVKPLILLFLPQKWNDCIQLVQILSIGVGFQVVGSLWTVALRLKADFKKQALYAVLTSIYFLALVIPFSYFYKSTGTAIAVTLFNITSSPVLIYYSFKYFNINFREVIYPYIKYFTISSVVFGGIFLITTYFENIYFNLLLNSILSPILYGGIVLLIDKNLILDLFSRFKNR